MPTARETDRVRRGQEEIPKRAEYVARLLYRMVNRARAVCLELHDMDRLETWTTEEGRRVRVRSFARLRRTAAIVAELVLAVCCAGAGVSLVAQAGSAAPFGLAARHAARAYLNMPDSSKGRIPRLLSQTGAFNDVRNLIPSEALIPYDLVVPFWSDGAPSRAGSRCRTAKIEFSPTGEWTFPRARCSSRPSSCRPMQGNPTSGGGSRRGCWFATLPAGLRRRLQVAARTIAMRTCCPTVCTKKFRSGPAAGRTMSRPGITRAARIA